MKALIQLTHSSLLCLSSFLQNKNQIEIKSNLLSIALYGILNLNSAVFFNLRHKVLAMKFFLKKINRFS